MGESIPINCLKQEIRSLHTQLMQVARPIRKAFSQELHDENDKPAKIAVARFIKRVWGFQVAEGETYGVDIEILENGLISGFVEVERRHNWVDKFPFDTLHIPERKRKFFDCMYPTVLFSVRKDLSQAIWVRDVDIVSSPVELKDNKYCKQEPFFVVPLNKCRLVDLCR